MAASVGRSRFLLDCPHNRRAGQRSAPLSRAADRTPDPRPRLRNARRLRSETPARRPARRRRNGLADDAPSGCGPLRLVGLAPDPARRRRPARALGSIRSHRRDRSRHRRAARAPDRPQRALGAGGRRGDRGAAESVRAAARLRDRGCHRASERRRLKGCGTGRGPAGRRSLPRGSHRDREPTRRRRGAARTRPRLQVDRRPGQPPAPSARPARGPGRDTEPGRRRAADRGRGACSPPFGPLRRPRPATEPEDEGQRRRPSDERGVQHRPCADPASRGPARGDPRRRQLRRRDDRSGATRIPRHPRPDPERVGARATHSAPASPR